MVTSSVVNGQFNNLVEWLLLPCNTKLINVEFTNRLDAAIKEYSLCRIQHKLEA